jgi:hypothetical protein
VKQKPAFQSITPFIAKIVALKKNEYLKKFVEIISCKRFC